jgi:hypothetical protein
MSSNWRLASRDRCSGIRLSESRGWLVLWHQQKQDSKKLLPIICSTIRRGGSICIAAQDPAQDYVEQPAQLIVQVKGRRVVFEPAEDCRKVSVRQEEA